LGGPLINLLQVICFGKYPACEWTVPSTQHLHSAGWSGSRLEKS
jgi:hypothetical protein